MADLSRFSVSLETDLLEKFDRHCATEQIATRSEAIRQLLHRALTDDAWENASKEALATLTLVYDHHRPGLVQALLDAQHSHAELVVSTMHVHLDHAHCLEVVVLRGKPPELRALTARLGGLKGVRCGDLAVAHVPGATGDAHHHHHHGESS